MVGFFSLECNATEALLAAKESEENGDSAPWLWLVGLGCSVVSSAATAVGTILQKKAHNLQQSLPDEEKAPEIAGIVFNKYWLWALVIMVFLPLPFDFASFALAPQSVIVPMTGLTIVLSAIAAVVILKERLTKIEVIGTFTILCGVALTTVTAGGNSETLTLCDILDRYIELDFLIPASALMFSVFVNMYWLKTENYPSALEKFKPQMYAFVAGGLGAIMQVLFKATGELAKGSADGVGGNTWRTVHPYYHIIGVVVLAVGMLSYLNLLLSRVDAVIATPLYFTNLIVCSSTIGLLFYKEYKGFEVWQWVVFPLGILVVCMGVAFMSLKGINLDELRLKEAMLQKSKENRMSLEKAARERGESTGLRRVVSLKVLQKSNSSKSLGGMTKSKSEAAIKPVVDDEDDGPGLDL